jgi:hypothetical protein
MYRYRNTCTEVHEETKKYRMVKLGRETLEVQSEWHREE